MIFNSLEFLIFLPLVFALYWLIPRRNVQLQNSLIVIASYVFYGWWDYRFLLLIMASSLVDYSIGLLLYGTTHAKRRKILLYISLLVNLGLLGFFKYFNFFIESFANSFSLLGQSLSVSTLNIVLPVGVSFYTFQTLSYTIDIYKQRIKPTKNIISFMAFVSFFPQLVAGPIERASHLLPQFYKKRKFIYANAVDGLYQIFWGFFKKVVIADNCGQFADLIFNNSNNYSGSTLFLGALFFTFQIYGDFSGYSDIAIGTSRLFGFDLMKNFNFPYFSRDIAEFWRRWHISLSTWFRDYLYIPLGGSKGGSWRILRNTIIIFVVSGFWHGANWTFILWGLINALYFIPLLVLGKNRRHLDVVAKDRLLPSISELISIGKTFTLTVFAWIFFRANDVGHAIEFIVNLFNGFVSKSALTDTHTILLDFGFANLVMLILCFVIEWIGREKEYGFQIINKYSRFVKIICCSLLLAVILMFMNTNETEFIYFQF